MKFIVMALDDFIFGNEEWHESERQSFILRNFNFENII